MEIIKVNLGRRSYDIVVGRGAISRLGRQLKKLDIGSDAYVITNALVKNKYGCLLQDALTKYGFNLKFKIVPDTEKSKSIESASRLVKGLAAFDKKRKIFIIAFGGGVVGDLAGFVASIYKRGVPFVQVPTTLLAQVDSAIGGKTAVDLSEGKNLVGAFYQPKLVLSDTELLKTLSRRQIRCGLSEVIKYAVIRDPELFVYLEKHYEGALNLNPAVSEYIVSRCSRIKAEIVRRDEREELGLRTVLNFGHTIGHAIEAAVGYAGYNHGEAIALGMIAALEISRQSGLIKEGLLERIKSLIDKIGLPVSIKGVSIGAIINAHYHDKKFLGSRNRFVLLKDIGRTAILEDIPLKVIRESIEKLQEI